MKISDESLAALALALSAERKRQKLSREAAAAVCGVSTSFIRDAESSPENCSLGKLAKLVNGLGLSLEVAGLETSGLQALRPGMPKSEQKQGIASLAKSEPLGLIAAAMKRQQTDFGVPESQLVDRAGGGLSDLMQQRPTQSSGGLGLPSLIAQRRMNKPKGEPS